MLRAHEPSIPSTPARALLAVLALTALGCGRTHLFYNATEMRHAPLLRVHEPAIDQFLVDKLAGRTVTWVDEDGHAHAVSDVRKLGLAERGALWLALSPGDVGGESDLRVRVGKRSIPVSVFVALDGNVRVVSGRRSDDGASQAPSLREIQSRFDLQGRMPGRWTDDERRALHDALTSLAPQELAVLRDVHFDRQPQPRSGDASRAAQFEMQGCRAIIFLFSSGVRADAFRFVGDPTAPKSAVLHSIIHEIGHAFEQSAARDRFCAAGRARGAAANDLVRAGNQLTNDSPLLSAYLRALGGEPAPTDYGNTSPHESFAEAFALFHVDAHALARTSPRAHAFFAKGAHIPARQASQSRNDAALVASCADARQAEPRPLHPVRCDR